MQQQEKYTKRTSRAVHIARTLARETNRLFHSRAFRREYNTDGIDVLNQDWDIMIILDACRADVFEDLVPIEGHYQRVESRGAQTLEFLRGNFQNRSLLDTVYVTANPMYRRNESLINARFHATIDVWMEAGWNDTYNTVLPETVADWTIKASDRFPNKRLIAHFIQPHFPFITDDVRESWLTPDPASGGRSFWKQIRCGQLSFSRAELWDAYRDNLSTTIPHVKRIIDQVTGKTVITSDHGNLFGERIWPAPIRDWGHPDQTYVGELISVPWLSVSGTRRKISENKQIHLAKMQGKNPGERLRELGYSL